MNSSYCFCASASASTCFRLQPCEVALDHLDHADNAAILAAHALVWLVEDLRLLHKRRCIGSLGVEVLEHAERLSNSSLCVLRVLDRDRVFCLLLLTDARRLRDSGVELGNGLGEFSDLLRELRN